MTQESHIMTASEIINRRKEWKPSKEAIAIHDKMVGDILNPLIKIAKSILEKEAK